MIGWSPPAIRDDSTGDLDGRLLDLVEFSLHFQERAAPPASCGTLPAESGAGGENAEENDRFCQSSQIPFCVCAILEGAGQDSQSVW